MVGTCVIRARKQEFLQYIHVPAC